MCSCIPHLHFFYNQAHPYRKTVQTICGIGNIQFLSQQMVIPYCYFNLRYRENLRSKNKMPEDLVNSKFTIFVCPKIVFVVKSRVIIADIKLVKVMCSK